MTLNPETISEIKKTYSGKKKIAALRKPLFAIFLIAFVCITALLFVYYGTQVRSLKKRTKLFDRFFTAVEEEGYSHFLPHLGRLSMPLELQTTPLANRSGLVLDTKKIEIRNVAAAYNPSMIKRENGYLLFFRFDEINRDSPYGFYTNIGYCELDENFEQTEKEFTVIDTGSQFSEDPRAVQIGEEIYLSFNDIQQNSRSNYRSVHIGKLNLQESKLDYSTDLDLQVKLIEKNWVPFERIENGKPEIYFEYYLNPQKVMKLPNPEANSLLHAHYPGASLPPRLFWPPMWGEPRGGATARLVDGQYLSFFHSFFEDFHGMCWYVMAAYRFEKDPPFRVTAISHHPILFDGIYDSPHMNTAEIRKRVLFPGSFTEGMKEGKEVLYVCCGENDCAIKLITIDKRMLLQNLKRL